MVKLLSALITVLFCSLQLNAQTINAIDMERVYVSDTIESFKAAYDKSYFADEYFRPDTILSIDSNEQTMLFFYAGKLHAAYYDSSNKGQWPYTNNWISWPLSAEGRYTLPNDIYDISLCNDFSAALEFISISGKRLLRIDWRYYFCGSSMWTTIEGTQIWNMKTQTCYFDFITGEHVEISGRNTPEDEPTYEDCNVAIKAKNNLIEISKNTCGKYPKIGIYQLKSENLIKENN